MAQPKNKSQWLALIDEQKQSGLSIAKFSKKKQINEAYLYLRRKKPDSPIPNIVLYDYQRSHSGQCPVAFLDGYNKYLQMDGYVGYEQTLAILVGCMAHARRKFMEAKQSQPTGKSGKADKAVLPLNKLEARLEKSS